MGDLQSWPRSELATPNLRELSSALQSLQNLKNKTAAEDTATGRRCDPATAVIRRKMPRALSTQHGEKLWVLLLGYRGGEENQV